MLEGSMPETKQSSAPTIRAIMFRVGILDGLVSPDTLVPASSPSAWRNPRAPSLAYGYTDDPLVFGFKPLFRSKRKCTV